MIKPLVALTALTLLAAPAAAQTTTSGDSAWVTPMLQRMVQPDNARRLEALKAMLKEKGIAFTVADFPGSPDSQGVPGHNVVVTIGDGPRDLVLGAHYDAVIQENGKAVDGVVDNGASVVALVQAIEALQGYGPRHRVVVVFFDQEELGLLGSKAWLAQVDRSRIDAAVIFDVDAYGDSVIYGGMKSDTRGVVRGVVQGVCTRKALDCIRFDNFPPSDDQSFAVAGIPVVSIGQQPAVDAHQLWLLMHKGRDSGLAQGVMPRVFTLIHTPDDNMGAVEAPAVNRAFEMAFELIRELDEAYALPSR
ncbi:MAG: Zn-dependent exopeptidase M28 [Caulobacteraceae bacterium]|nr:Zn-dependent exopeptidase M28 [Caulobacteraceae bacterium]